MAASLKKQFPGEEEAIEEFMRLMKVKLIKTKNVDEIWCIRCVGCAREWKKGFKRDRLTSKIWNIIWCAPSMFFCSLKDADSHWPQCIVVFLERTFQTHLCKKKSFCLTIILFNHSPFVTLQVSVYKLEALFVFGDTWQLHAYYFMSSSHSFVGMTPSNPITYFTPWFHKASITNCVS